MIINRILVTGSRDWDAPDTIAYALRYLVECENVADDAVLVSGACPTGADRIAEGIWLSLGRPIELHPADWLTHGKKAGFVRNDEMVKAGADICLAFIKNESKGATMTAELAGKAGIPVYTYLMREEPNVTGTV